MRAHARLPVCACACLSGSRVRFRHGATPPDLSSGDRHTVGKGDIAHVPHAWACLASDPLFAVCGRGCCGQCVGRHRQCDVRAQQPHAFRGSNRLGSWPQQSHSRNHAARLAGRHPRRWRCLAAATSASVVLRGTLRRLWRIRCRHRGPRRKSCVQHHACGAGWIPKPVLRWLSRTGIVHLCRRSCRWCFTCACGHHYHRRPHSGAWWKRRRCCVVKIGWRRRGRHGSPTCTSD
jgi:hypothetical protein